MTKQCIFEMLHQLFIRFDEIVCMHAHFLQASPWPDIMWQKDGAPVSKKVTISNTEGQSQLLITSAERTDTGIYTIIVKNIVGQETFSIEIRVTGENL